MTSLYNCKHSGDQYRITKFDNDWNVKASYLCDLVSCECPAGHRPKCRHREMLPKFIQRDHIGDEWFFDHDRGGWVQGASKELEESQGMTDDEASEMLKQPNQFADEALKQMDEDEKALWDSLAPAGLGQPSDPTLGKKLTMGLMYGTGKPITEILSLPQYNDVPIREVESLEPPPSPPSPTIRRRV